MPATGAMKSRMIAAASSENATAIVFSRPMWSLTQPQNGRVIPLRVRSPVMV